MTLVELSFAGFALVGLLGIIGIVVIVTGRGPKNLNWKKFRHSFRKLSTKN